MVDRIRLAEKARKRKHPQKACRHRQACVIGPSNPSWRVGDNRFPLLSASGLAVRPSSSGRTPACTILHAAKIVKKQAALLQLREIFPSTPVFVRISRFFLRYLPPFRTGPSVCSPALRENNSALRISYSALRRDNSALCLAASMPALSAWDKAASDTSPEPT